VGPRHRLAGGPVLPLFLNTDTPRLPLLGLTVQGLVLDTYPVSSAVSDDRDSGIHSLREHLDTSTPRVPVIESRLYVGYSRTPTPTASAVSYEYWNRILIKSEPLLSTVETSLGVYSIRAQTHLRRVCKSLDSVRGYWLTTHLPRDCKSALSWLKEPHFGLSVTPPPQLWALQTRRWCVSPRVIWSGFRLVSVSVNVIKSYRTKRVTYGDRRGWWCRGRK